MDVVVYMCNQSITKASFPLKSRQLQKWYGFSRDTESVSIFSRSPSHLLLEHQHEVFGALMPG